MSHAVVQDYPQHRIKENLDAFPLLGITNGTHKAAAVLDSDTTERTPIVRSKREIGQSADASMRAAVALLVGVLLSGYLALNFILSPEVAAAFRTFLSLIF